MMSLIVNQIDKRSRMSLLRSLKAKQRYFYKNVAPPELKGKSLGFDIKILPRNCQTITEVYILYSSSGGATFL
jgi:hypothetical protein